MTQLKELTRAGEKLVQRTLEDGERVTEIDPTKLAEHAVPIPDLDADLEALKADLEAVTADNEGPTHMIDVGAAPVVHQALPFTRRQAARKRLWHWLAVSELHKFVYHRWGEYGDIEGKFLEGGTNIYSNAIHRLWWGAQVTYDPDSDDPYARTRLLFSQGELANDVLDRWFARYRPAAVATIDALSGESSDLISDITRDLRQELSNYTLELMDEAEVSAVIERLLAER